MNDHDELYPLDQWEASAEIAAFKAIMTEVVYQTTGIYFDKVQEAENGTLIYCQLWTRDATGETLTWYAISGDYLRHLKFEAAVAMARAACERQRDDNLTRWQRLPTKDEYDAEMAWRAAHPDGEGWRTDKHFNGGEGQKVE